MYAILCFSNLFESEYVLNFRERCHKQVMNRKNIIKNFMWSILGTTLLTSLFVLMVIAYDIWNLIYISKQLLMDLSPLNILLIIAYTTSFLFLIYLAVFFILFFICHKVIIKFPGICFKGYLLLCWILVILYCGSGITTRMLHIQVLPHLLIVPLWIILLVAILFIFRWIRKSKEKKEIIRISIAAFVALVISAYLYQVLDTKFTSPLTKENILLALINLAVSGLTAALCYYLFYKLSSLAYNKIIYLKFLMILFIGLNLGISIFGFVWENRENSLTYEEVKSNAKEDINVILIVIDALRADHLGCYGYEKQTSPNIDAFAKEAVLFKNCYVQASWTKPSVASILTSLYPTTHGATFDASKLPGEVTTLAEILHAAGYITYGYVSNPHLKRLFNFEQGFYFYDDYLMKKDKLYYFVLGRIPIFNKFIRGIVRGITGKELNYHDYDNIKVANKRILPWLERYKAENFFMYIHYMDPHDPYSPPRFYSDMFPYTKGDMNSKDISSYDGEIRFLDDNIKELFGMLKSSENYDKTLIIITADHGEAFGEHGDFLHGHTIYQELLRVPLIIKYPRHILKGVVIEKQVRSIDIMPTVLDVLKITYDAQLEGLSLLPLSKQDGQISFCEDIFINNNHRNNTSVLQGIIKDNEWKYIYTEKSKLRDVRALGNEEIYNLINDPNELNNLVEREPEVLKRMRNRIDFYKTYTKKKAISSSTKLDYETIQQLRSLGYMQ